MTFPLSPHFRKDVEKLPKSDRKRVKEALCSFRDEGHGDIKKVGEELRRLRVGEHRIYYSPKGEDTYVLRVVHRRRAFSPEVIDALLRRIGGLKDGTGERDNF